MKNNDIRTYLDSVKRELVVPSPEKKKIIADLKNNILLSKDELNPSSIDDIIEHFGSPEEIAHFYMSSANSKQIKKTLTLTKWLKFGILFICIFIIIMYIISVLSGNSVKATSFEDTITTEEVQ